MEVALFAAAFVGTLCYLNQTDPGLFQEGATDTFVNLQLWQDHKGREDNQPKKFIGIDGDIQHGIPYAVYERPYGQRERYYVTDFQNVKTTTH